MTATCIHLPEIPSWFALVVCLVLGPGFYLFGHLMGWGDDAEP